MKKWIVLLLTATLLAGLAAGCGEKPDARFTAENEIVTYTRLDSGKTKLTVSSLGNNADVRSLSAAFEAKNPDVQVICVDLTGGTAAYRPVVDWVVNGVAPDVMFVNTDSFVNDATIEENMEDLSGSPVIGNFEMETLERLAVNGHVYFLPSPSEINCILYNQTLFEQYGWRVPTTFDEFVALCVQIREDSGGAIEPWNPNAKYDNVFSTALQAFTYEQLFGGVDNRSWYNDFCAGQGSFAGHIEPLFDAVQTLIDNGLLREEHFSYSATTRGKDFLEGRLAMYNAPISRMASDTYTFGYMPYPPTAGTQGYVNEVFSALLCVPKKTHTDAERDALERYIAFFSTSEGQQALIGESLMVSNVKGVPLNESAAMDGIKSVIAEGHRFSRLDFPASGGGTLVRNWSLRDCALLMTTGEKTAAQLIAEIDEKPYKAAGDAGSAVKIATIAQDFTTWEFSCYIADMYRETAGAEIGLINHGIAYRGNLVRLFTGDIYDSYMYPIKPRSFANDSTLVKASMTGRQILDALNHPVGNECVSNSVYAFSGLRCEIAPWNALGEKLRSVQLADGAALAEDGLYTVAFWDGSVAEEYITAKLETYEGTWETLMQAKMSADGALVPAKDGRCKLIWP